MAIVYSCLPAVGVTALHNTTPESMAVIGLLCPTILDREVHIALILPGVSAALSGSVEAMALTCDR